MRLCVRCLHEHENFHFIRIDWKHQHEIDIRKANTTNAKVFASKNKHSNTQRKHSPFVRYRQIRSLNLKISENHHRCRRQITTWNKNCRDIGAQEKLALSRMVWAMKKSWKSYCCKHFSWQLKLRYGHANERNTSWHLGTVLVVKYSFRHAAWKST